MIFLCSAFSMPITVSSTAPTEIPVHVTALASLVEYGSFEISWQFDDDLTVSDTASGVSVVVCACDDYSTAAAVVVLPDPTSTSATVSGLDGRYWHA